MRDFETNIYASNFWYTRVFLPTVQALISRGVGVGSLFTEVALFNHSDGCRGGAPSVSHFSSDSLVLSNSYELL